MKVASIAKIHFSFRRSLSKTRPLLLTSRTAEKSICQTADRSTLVAAVSGGTLCLGDEIACMTVSFSNPAQFVAMGRLYSLQKQL